MGGDWALSGNQRWRGETVEPVIFCFLQKTFKNEADLGELKRNFQLF